MSAIKELVGKSAWEVVVENEELGQVVYDLVALNQTAVQIGGFVRDRMGVNGLLGNLVESAAAYLIAEQANLVRIQLWHKDGRYLYRRLIGQVCDAAEVVSKERAEVIMAENPAGVTCQDLANGGGWFWQVVFEEE